MKKILVLATSLMLGGMFAAQNSFAAGEHNAHDACRAEAADAGIVDKDELENYIADCIDMMDQGAQDEGDVQPESDNQPEGDEPAQEDQGAEASPSAS
ncbi:MAG: hypothetical protein OEW58_03110 [Gammaproteobacteria bacterium]|nr:hypothetical protein [Gammaproteobacteria bacterium]